MVGIGIVCGRFSAGVEAGVMMRENLALDPVLEREAANIKATSLYGSRTAGALQRTVSGSSGAVRAVGSPEPDTEPNARPKRVI